MVETAWNAISEDQRKQIKNFITDEFIKSSQQANVAIHLQNKLNGVLVGIVKREWTTTWTEFIP